MNKHLTIDELKALEVGDWVWIKYQFENTLENFYAQVRCNSSEKKYLKHYAGNAHLVFWTYGKTWLAYKNKEQAEAKGEIVELPCLRKSKSTTLPQYEVVYIGEYDKIIVERFTFEPAAKRRLAELKGE